MRVLIVYEDSYRSYGVALEELSGDSGCARSSRWCRRVSS